MVFPFLWATKNTFFLVVQWNLSYGIIHKDLDPWRKRKTSCMYTNTCFLHSGTQPNCVSHVFSVVFGLFFEFVHNKNRKHTRLHQVLRLPQHRGPRTQTPIIFLRTNTLWFHVPGGNLMDLLRCWKAPDFFCVQHGQQDCGNIINSWLFPVI